MRTRLARSVVSAKAVFAASFAVAFLSASAAIAAPKQLIFSLSQNQAHSDALRAWGVPAFVTIGGDHPKGFYISGVTGEGLATQMGLQTGDVLLSVSGHVILDARQADTVLSRFGRGNLKAVFARAEGGSIKIYNPVVAFAGGTFGGGTAGGSSGSSAHGGQSVAMVASRGNVDASTIASLESYMFDLVNKDRAEYKLPPLAKSSSLSALARRYAEDMAKRKFFAHQDPDGNQPRDRANNAGIHASVWENLALQEGSNPLMELVARGEAQMMAEPPGQLNHRGCILHPDHKCVGIGVAVVGPKVYCVQEFSPASLP